MAKTATTAARKSACTVLIIFVGLTLGLFAWLKVYDHARIIQVTLQNKLGRFVATKICLMIKIERLSKYLYMLGSIVINVTSFSSIPFCRISVIAFPKKCDKHPGCPAIKKSMLACRASKFSFFISLN